MATLFGSGIKRREAPRLITGKAPYPDDVKLPGLLYAAVLRSTYAHAKLRKVDVAKAKQATGVVAVYTGADVKDKVNTVPCAWNVPNCDLKVPPHPPLAVDKVRYVGDGLAMVVAESRAAARDALDLIDVDYEALDAVVDPEKATQKGAPELHKEVPGNVAFTWKVAGGDAAKAFAEAPVTVEQRIVQNRLLPTAMEPRAACASYNPGTGQLTLWITSQNPHIHRFLLSVMTKLPEHKIHVIAPEVGGGFGSKIPGYADEALVSFASMQLGRPVKWTEDRSENYKATIHGRDHVEYVAMCGTKDGHITGLRTKVYAGLGGYASTAAPGVPTILHGLMYSGPYTIPNIDGTVYGVYTTTTPVDAYRGAGRPEATFLLERMIDLYARKIGMDPVDVRRKNLIPKDKVPYTVATGITYESGDGQGEETTFAQIVADEFGIPVENVEVVAGDTEATPQGWGTYGSRTTAVCGSAVKVAAQRVKDKAKKIAAHLLEASEADLEWQDGKFAVKGSPDKGKTFGELALMANVAWNLPPGVEPGLEATAFFDPSNFVYPFGTHICTVDVDPETGEGKILRYIPVDDCRPQINPMIVDGQVHGGVIQGLGEALQEMAVYDEDGQLLTGTMMDYAIPKASQMPKGETAHTVTPSPVNPLGVVHHRAGEELAVLRSEEHTSELQSL